MDEIEISLKGTTVIKVDNPIAKEVYDFKTYRLGKCCYRVRGIADEKKSRHICGLLMGYILVSRETSNDEYCDELKAILAQGYFEIENFDGVFIRRIEIPKDWKPAIFDSEKYELDSEHYCRPYTVGERIKDWFSDYWGAILGIGGFLLGICGLFLGLFL